MKVRHALVPVDLSGAARRPLAELQQMIDPGATRITLLHVVQGLDLPSFAVARDEVPREVREEIDEARPLVEELAGPLRDGGFEAECRIVTGSARAEAIARFAEDHGVDLIVLTAHGHRGLQRLVLGSVADGILRLSPVPMLVFPAREDAEPGSPEPPTHS